MSVFYGVRLRDDLSERIEATGQGKTEVITAALDAYFGAGVVKAERPARERKARIVEPDPLAVALELAASGVEEPVTPAAKIIEPFKPTTYQRPAHAENCRCYQCKPPK